MNKNDMDDFDFDEYMNRGKNKTKDSSSDKDEKKKTTKRSRRIVGIIFLIIGIILMVIIFGTFMGGGMIGAGAFFVPVLAFMFISVGSTLIASSQMRMFSHRFNGMFDHFYKGEDEEDPYCGEVSTDINRKKRCPKCGEENDGDAQYCNTCGSPLTKTCSYCGEKNDIEAKFCRKCGKKF